MTEQPARQPVDPAFVAEFKAYVAAYVAECRRTDGLTARAVLYIAQKR